MNHDPDCLFCKIIAGTIPSKKLYEDDDCLAFNDIHPAAPIHFLMIPKKHIAMLAEVTFEDTKLLGKMMVLAPKIALQAGARSGKAGGFKVLINNGADGGQEVYHMHMHVLAGPRPWKSVVPAPG
ncbi:MAG: histidine triad nucleotide-binding protein [Polynucleobacter sp.]|jgi:histidine triad (HIT) family protein|nr:histidine triad nucleotide-binding protein [Polynucleobacter sp.]